MAEPGRTWVVGAIAWDEVAYLDAWPRPGDVLHAAEHVSRQGGAGANTARGLVAVVPAVELVGYVGDDWYGEQLLHGLRVAGVGVDHVRRVDGPSSRCLLLIDPGGERSIIGLTHDRISEVALPHEQITTGDVVFFSSLPVDFADQIRRARNHGASVVSVPPPDLSSPVEAHYIVGSERQLPEEAPDDLFSLWSQRPGARLEALVVTRGPKGATVTTAEGTIEFAARPATTIDTTGAGDAFAAGFVATMQRGQGLEQAVTAGLEWGARAVESRHSTVPCPPASLLTTE